MKKFTFVSLGFALVCWIVAGICLAIFGEKGFEDLSKEIVGRKMLQLQTRTESTEADAIRKVEELEVIFPEANVEILPSEDDGLHVEYSGTDKQEPLRGRIEGKRIKYDLGRYYEGAENKIVVRIFNGNGIIHLGDSGNARLTFKIPKTIKRIKGRSETGDLKIDSINAATVKFESTSGGLRITKMNLSKLDAVTTSGDVRFQGYAQSADFKTVSGDLRVESENKSPKFNIVTTSGDVKVDFEEEPNVKFSYETTSGDLTLKVGTDLKEMRLTSKVAADAKESKRRDKLKLGSAEGDLKIKTVSGNIQVRSASF